MCHPGIDDVKVVSLFCTLIVLSSCLRFGFMYSLYCVFFG